MTRAVAIVRDLMFRSKIDAVARVSGAEVGYASTIEAAIDRCAEAAPTIVFVDLSGAPSQAGDIAKRIREAAPMVRIVGFASHVDMKALRAARDAGFDLTLSREEFTSRLAELLGGT